MRSRAPEKRVGPSLPPQRPRENSSCTKGEEEKRKKWRGGGVRTEGRRGERREK